MSEDWNTKYGRRRVRRDPPTLDEAIFAAIGITDDQEAQAEIAASLMGLPIESVQAEVKKALPAAERGDARAQGYLGFMYQYGRGVPQSYPLALYWYRRGAEQGDPAAQHLLGLMYDKGHGVDRD